MHQLIRSRAGVATALAVGLAAALNASTASAAPSLEVSDLPLGRVADIRPGTAGSAPSLITAYDGGVYFVADDGTHGARVWRSDGTSAGTTLVSSTAVVSPLSSELATIGTTVFFSSGDQLWRSDGTEAGTHLVKDINPAAAVAPLEQLTVAGSLVWFLADDGIGGRELWRSDGTEAGTIKLTDRPPGADSNPLDNLTAVGSRLWFTGGDGTDIVSEVWRSDGTPAGTGPLTRFRRFFDTYPDLLTPAGGYVYFVLGGGSEGRDVFRIAETGSVVEHVFGDEADTVMEIAAAGDALWFAGSTYLEVDGGNLPEAIWRSDGTPAGTRLVKVLPFEATGDATRSHAQDLTPIGDNVFFTHDDAEHGPELWRSNGTTAGTRRLTDLPGTGLETRPGELVASGGALYFVAEQEGHGRELWTSDGTLRGTHPVADSRPGWGSSDPNGLTDVGGRLFFSQDDGVSGQELWRTQRDTAVARLRVSAPRTQRAHPNLKWVKAKVGAGEWVTSVGRGRIAIPGARKRVVLRPATVTSYAGRSETLRLVIPRTARTSVLRAVRQYRHASGPRRVQLKVVARVTIKVRDSSGNAKKVVRKIRLT